MDCKDESDEHLCSHVQLDENKYRNALLPRDTSGADKMKLILDIDLLKIVKIHEPEVSAYFLLDNLAAMVKRRHFFRCTSL